MSVEAERTVLGTHEPELGSTSPVAAPTPTAEEMKAVSESNVLDVASQWDLMRWKFMRHKAAVVALGVVLFIYLVGAFVEIIAPQDPNATSGVYRYVPPMTVHLFEADSWRWSPHVYGYKSETDPKTFRRQYVEDPEQVIPIGLFVEGYTYRLWGLFEWNRHLLGPVDPRQPFYLLGADRLGRDNLSRIIYGTRVSMSIGLVGVAISLVVGLILGGISGYYGGRIDQLIQRTIEFLRSMPTIPLWMGLAAALPIAWDPIVVYVLITLILALIGWTHLARVVRGQFLAIRNEDYVMAARLAGASEYRIITKHMLPSMTSYIIAALTLAVPEMILGETALSFLGLGLRPPVVSWGVLLQDAQNLRSISLAPWLLSPGAAVVMTVLAFNFLGDGLRDAADPYGQ